MAEHNDLGKKGEAMAEQYLSGKGFFILHKNWRHSYYEIDIIATRGNLLHFIEIKTRRSVAGGHPEDAVTKKKFRRLLNAADEFLFQHPQYRHVQYDILAITLHKNREDEFFLLEDVFL
ncbi:MAG: hypothetical protein GC171_10925 [Terrimonas sp.]|nr:hypothetical protein [Terrimonas sp.]